ncbi:MAG: hypothetical protein ACREK8_09590 [Gemmatimonadales bacterium]
MTSVDDRALHVSRTSFRWMMVPGFWIAVALLAAVIDAWGSRFNLNPDGISYIDMARHAVEHGPAQLINGLWSPGYPGLLMWPVEWTAAQPAVMIPALHLTNLILYVMALGLFLQLLRAVESRAPADPMFTQYTTAFGAVFFAAIGVISIGLGLITPDFAVLLCVLAAAACCFQLERTASTSWAIALGAVMGIGYWMKGILLPLNLLFLVLLFVIPPRIDRARVRIAMAAMGFAVVGMPLVFLVSRHVGRATTGEVGRLNYAWEIDGVTPFVGWLGDSTGRFGVPEHPPRILQRDPLTLEFAEPVHATYPLWFDPAYWYAGLKPRFDVSGHWRAFVRGLLDIGQMLLDQWVVIAGVLALGFATTRAATPALTRRTPLVLGLWSLGAGLVYASVHVEPRYLAGFLLTGTIAVWAWLSRRAPRRALRVVLPVVLVGILASVAFSVQQNTGGFDTGYRPDYLIDADRVAAAGVRPGDHVATVGDAFEQYVAFAAGTPIIAQVIDSLRFWQASPGTRSALQGRLAAAGVRALLANNVDSAMSGEGWRIFAHSDSSNLGVLLLPRVAATP